MASLEPLRPCVNLAEPDLDLLVASPAAALRPVGPYSIPGLYGEQGWAKITLAKFLRLLIDPQACSLLAEPKTSSSST